MSHIKRAATKGLASAQFELGRLFAYGEKGVDRHETEAKAWLLKAKRQGFRPEGDADNSNWKVDEFIQRARSLLAFEKKHRLSVNGLTLPDRLVRILFPFLIF